MRNARLNPVPRVLPGRRGFTLIEVLVVVAIIALLIAILLPSLSRARDQTRTAMCISNLKQMIQGTLMYVQDSKDYLPGPLHVTVWRNTWEVRLVMEKGGHSQGTIKFWTERQLPLKIAKYLGETGTQSRTSGGVDRGYVRQSRLADEIARCPVAELLKPSDKWPAPSLGLAPFSYALNNYWTGSDPGGAKVRGTTPPKYFGFSDYNSFDPDRSKSNDTQPVQLTRINRPADEWAVADAWYRVGDTVRGQPLYMAGPWQHQSGSPYLPEYPFHNGGQPAQKASQLLGLTGANFFDGHAAAIRGWKGTVNFDPGGNYSQQ